MKKKMAVDRKVQENIWYQVGAFLSGRYNSPDSETQIKAGWYDWFCKDEALARKTKKLYKKLMSIQSSKKLNCETSYVFFKNNCPMNGTLYDDFRICDIKSGEVIWTIIPESGHKSAEGQGEVWGAVNDFEEPVFTGTWKGIKAWFLTKVN